jgi:aromatic-amino-acid transaminase
MPNARLWTSQHSLFATLKDQPADALLSLIADFAEDPRASKIDLGVGVFRDESGATPVFAAVKQAEQLLVNDQSSKTYLGPEGDPAFVEILKPMVCGSAFAQNDRLVGVQTPGGTGALRLAAELIAAAAPSADIWLGLPTWPNHAPIFSSARLAIEAYQRYDIRNQKLLFDEMLTSLKSAKPGDVIVLQGCCHNPTGADFDLSQWTALAEIMTLHGLVPLIDLAYQGLGQGLAPDRAGLEIVLRCVGEALVAYSCDKNFGLYRERTGALFAFGQTAGRARTIYSNLLSLARTNWSMPPDHGAAVVRAILESPTLKVQWQTELEGMRKQIVLTRQDLAIARPSLAPLLHQHGMFALLPLDPPSVGRLRIDHGIYMAASGRINIAGFRKGDIQRFVTALDALEIAQNAS